MRKIEANLPDDDVTYGIIDATKLTKAIANVGKAHANGVRIENSIAIPLDMLNNISDTLNEMFDKMLLFKAEGK